MLLLLYIPGYETSLQLVFSWLLRLLALYFNCNSGLSWEMVSVTSSFSAIICISHNVLLLEEESYSILWVDCVGFTLLSISGAPELLPHFRCCE